MLESLLLNIIPMINNFPSEEVKDAFKTAAAETKQQVNQSMKDAKAHVQETWDQASDTMTQFGKDIDSYARQKPWMVTLVGAAIGLIIGVLLTSHRDRN